MMVSNRDTLCMLCERYVYILNELRELVLLSNYDEEIKRLNKTLGVLEDSMLKKLQEE